jgi:hypothetical protein
MILMKEDSSGSNWIVTKHCRKRARGIRICGSDSNKQPYKEGMMREKESIRTASGGNSTDREGVRWEYNRESDVSTYTNNKEFNKSE